MMEKRKPTSHLLDFLKYGIASHPVYKLAHITPIRLSGGLLLTHTKTFLKEMPTLTPEQKYRKLYESLYRLCEKEGWGDPFSYARSREIHMAGLLGHTVADDYSGADAYDEEGGCEYKSTIADKINATYNGISVQDSWEEQERYVVEEKIGNYRNHYYARYEGGKVAEVWKLKYWDVLKAILPRIKKQYKAIQDGTRTSKDHRIGAIISQGYIYEHGVKVI